MINTESFSEILCLPVDNLSTIWDEIEVIPSEMRESKNLGTYSKFRIRLLSFVINAAKC